MKRLGVAFLSALTMVLLIGVSTPGAVVSAQSDRPLSVAVGAQPYTLNPHGSDADSNLSVVSNFFEGLLQRDADGTLGPALATSWERIDADTWRFELRRGVEFHNGNDFTWEDVAFTMDRLSNAEVSEFLNFGSLVESVTPVDGNPWVIDIETASPVPYFIQNLHQIWIMDEESTVSRTPGEVAQNPIGTGAYRFVEWRKGSYIRMVANEDYWGGEPPITHVEIHPIIEASTRLAAIMSGQVDVLQGVPVAFIDTVKSNPNVKLITRPARRSIFLMLNNRPGSPTADLRVRKAMYLAINEQAIIEKVMFGAASPAAQIPDPPTTGYSEDIERLAYDLERARELMREAGYEDGFEITLTGPNDRYVQDEQIMAAVASQLAKIGITVNVEAEPSAIYIPKVTENELDFALLGWFDGSYDFGRSFTKLLHTVNKDAGLGGTNGTGYSNPELDEILAEARDTIDPEKREGILQRLNEGAMEQVAVIPLHYQVDTYAVNKRSGVNFTPRSDTWIVFKDVSYKQ